MNSGKAFELLVNRILINVGFSDVAPDGIYIYEGPPGKMIQGLGEAHNADVLVEPPVQTPFYSRVRLLIECKEYGRKVGLNTIRSALGLREDINHFEIVDKDKLLARRNQRRPRMIYDYERYTYQVVVASLNGFTVQAQEFAASHRIPLLEFDKMPFWHDFCNLMGYHGFVGSGRMRNLETSLRSANESQLIKLADTIGQHMAVAITNAGQLLFLYQISEGETCFSEYYTLHWSKPSLPWELRSGEHTYLFQLPKGLMESWLKNSANDLELKKEAINCKAGFLSNMVVYYTNSGLPSIKMISIDKYELERARQHIWG